MPLRFRLTLQYSALVGGILTFFSVVIFSLVNYLLINQVDKTLQLVVLEIQKNSYLVNLRSPNIVTLPLLNLTTNIYIQIWELDGQLHASSLSLGGYNKPLDPIGYQSSQSVYQNAYYQNLHLRVLTAPLVIDEQPAGKIQVGSDLAMIDSTRQTLVQGTVVVTLFSTVTGSIAAWFIVRQALAPISAATDTAHQIAHTDDFSRRIPYRGHESDEVGRLVATFNEITRRLEHLYTSQQRFLADVSHELRTPLTVIKGNVDLIRRTGCVDEESLSSIEEESDRLTRLVEDFLLEAQVNSGKLPLVFRPIELDSLLLEVSKEMYVIAHDRVQLKVTAIDQLKVNGDRDRLKQVLINIISNAIKYVPQGSKVYLSLGRIGENARLIVRDTGHGIPAQDLPHIFERFYRTEKTRTRTNISGFGLGLSIAFWIVTNHGGTIEVDSKEGKGTTFCIYLPLLKSNTD